MNLSNCFSFDFDLDYFKNSLNVRDQGPFPSLDLRIGLNGLPLFALRDFAQFVLALLEFQ